MPLDDYRREIERLRRENAEVLRRGAELRARQLRQESDEIARRIAAGRAALQTPVTQEEAQAFRDQFTADWEAWLEGHIEEQEAQEIAPREQYPGVFPTGPA